MSGYCLGLSESRRKYFSADRIYFHAQPSLCLSDLPFWNKSLSQSVKKKMLESCIKWPRFLLKWDSFFIIFEYKRMCTYVSVLVKSVSFYFIQIDKIDFNFHMYKVDCVVNVSLKINSWLSSYFGWPSIDWKLFEETDYFLLFIQYLLSCSYMYARHYFGWGGMCKRNKLGTLVSQ